jgi:dienelactone hydrolase
MRRPYSFLPIFLAFSTSFGHAAQPQEVVFDSLDGTALKAWVFQPVDHSKADIAKPKHGTVVAFHGCGGLYATGGARKGELNSRHQAMADLLVEQGYNVVFPDSLTPRGETSICVQAIGSRNITQKERRADALATLAWVAQQLWADAGRMAALGWSHGGSAVLAVTDANQKDVKNQQLKNQLSFKTAVAFYPGCAESRKNDYRPNAPLTLFLGADDDWTPPIPCIELAKQLQAETYPDKYAVELNVYEGAVHDFDNPVGTVVERKNIPSRLHPGQGVKAGANPAARQKAYTRLKEILKLALE